MMMATFCCTSKTNIFLKSCTGIYLIYIGIFHFVAQSQKPAPTAESIFEPNVALIRLLVCAICHTFEHGDLQIICSVCINTLQIVNEKLSIGLGKRE